MKHLILWEKYSNRQTNSDERMVKVIFTNQSLGDGTIYKIRKETKKHYYLDTIEDSYFYYRINKKTLEMKGITQDYDNKNYKGYIFDVPNPKQVIEL